MHSADTPLPDWARAHGKPVLHGNIKQTPDDFRVDEILGFSPAGDGEHDFLLIEKTDANTAWVARKLAQHAKVAPRDAGYSGMKDRRAVTTQWFSVRRPSGAGTDWDSLDLPGVKIVEQARHNRKLKRGSHSGNRFKLVVRPGAVDECRLTNRLMTIQANGVPNYYGLQRFGRNGNNLAMAKSVFAGKRVDRDRRSVAISAARSFIFNEVLSARVSAGTWNRVLDGEPVNLDGTGSFFVPDEIDETLYERLRLFDIHPTGPLWGRNASACAGIAAGIEWEIGRSNQELVTGLEKFDARTNRRALRMLLHDFDWQLSDDLVTFKFRLDKGCFATSALREIIYG